MKHYPNFPFSPRKWPFFYGWVILLVSAIGVIMSIPGQTMGVSLFTNHLIDAMDLSRFNLSLSYLFGTVLSALFLTRAGKLYDRYGARRMVLVIAIALGLWLGILSQIDHIKSFFTSFLPQDAHFGASLLLMTIGFFALRFLGQGTLTMINRNMSMKWFEKRRGMVLAIQGIFVSLSFSLAPLILSIGIDQWGWRGTWIILGCVLGLFFPIIVVIFFRDNPEDCGLQPDGKTLSIESNSEPSKTKPIAKSFTLSEAQRTPIFWAYCLSNSLFGLLITGFTFHLISIFHESSLSHQMAVSIFLPISIISVSSNFIGSWLADHIRLQFHLITLNTGTALYAIGLLFLGQFWGIFLIILGYGLAQGTFNLLNTVAWPRFFGTQYLGAISGRNMSLVVFSTALGPVLFGYSLQFVGHYHLAEWICLGAAGILWVFAVLFGNKIPSRA